MMKWLRNWLLKTYYHAGKALAPIARATLYIWRKGLLQVFRQFSKFARFVFFRVVAWCTGLNYRLLLQGLPALLVGVGALTILLFAAFTPAQEIEDRYKREAKNSVEAKKYVEAMTCYERLSHLQTDSREVLFLLAETTEAAGTYEWGKATTDGAKAEALRKLNQCMSIMKQLAEEGKYPRAHLWLARFYLALPYQSPLQKAQKRAISESHLLRALAAGPEEKEKDEATTLLGELYLSQGQYKDSEKYLLQVVNGNPKVRLLLMLVYEGQGKIEKARGEPELATKYFEKAKGEAETAVNFFQPRAEADSSNYDGRLRWAVATAFLKKFPEAVGILDFGWKQTGDPRYLNEITKVYINWFDDLDRSGEKNIRLCIAILQTGLLHDPKSNLLLERVLRMTAKGSTLAEPLWATAARMAGTANPLAALSLWIGTPGEANARALLESLAQGNPQAHFYLGLDCFERGEFEEARRHWNIASDFSPDFSAIANNLAWLLYTNYPKELNKALELSNQAVNKAPVAFGYRGTRGCILLKMGKEKEAMGDHKAAKALFDKAVEDLEAALTVAPNNPELHRSLAEIFDILQLPDLAKVHQRRYEELSKKTARQP